MKVNRMITGNNIDVLKTFPNNSIHLVVTSPPYDKLRDYQGYKFSVERLSKILYSKMIKGGVVVWIVADQVIDGSETLTSFKHAFAFRDAGFKVHDTMIYVRMARFPDKYRCNQAFEYMFVFVKGKIRFQNKIYDRKNKYAGTECHRGKHTVRNKDGTMKLMQKEKADDFIRSMGSRLNLWYFPAGGYVSTQDKIAFEHPAIFPENLARDHIKMWSNEGEIVVDPFNGSGTTTKMAYIENRKYIGIDISKKYNNIARERIKIAEKEKKEITFKKKIKRNTQNLMEC